MRQKQLAAKTSWVVSHINPPSNSGGSPAWTEEPTQCARVTGRTLPGATRLTPKGWRGDVAMQIAHFERCKHDFKKQTMSAPAQNVVDYNTAICIDALANMIHLVFCHRFGWYSTTSLGIAILRPGYLSWYGITKSTGLSCLLAKAPRENLSSSSGLRRTRPLQLLQFLQSLASMPSPPQVALP